MLCVKCNERPANSTALCDECWEEKLQHFHDTCEHCPGCGRDFEEDSSDAQSIVEHNYCEECHDRKWHEQFIPDDDPYWDGP